MAQVNPYNPGAVPSLSVGVPSLNNSGQVFRSLSNDIGQVRQQFAQTQQSKLMAIIQPLAQQAPFLGQAIGSRIGRDLTQARTKNAQVAQQHQKALANQSAAQSTYNFRDNSDNAMSSFQEQNKDNPARAQQQYKDFLDGSFEAALDDFDNGPNKDDINARNRLEAGMDSARLTQNERMGTWSRNVQTDQAHAEVDAAVNQTVRNIGAQQSGLPQAHPGMLQGHAEIDDKMIDADLGNRVNGYRVAVSNAGALLQDSRLQTGDKYSQQQIEKLVKQAPVALFQNILTTLPSDPTDQLRYIQRTQMMLDNNDRYAIPLEAGQKEGLQKQLNAAAEQAARGMVVHLKGQVLQTDEQDNVMRGQADQHWMDLPTQQGLMAHADSQTKLFQLKISNVTKDKTLPEAAKNVLIDFYDTRIKRMDSLVDTARTNIKYINTQAKEGALAAMREQREDQREGRRVAAAQLKENKDDAEDLLNKKLDNIYALKQEPQKNAAAILHATDEMVSYANQMHKAGYINANRAEFYRHHGASMGVDAATMQTEPKQIFGITLPWQPPVKKQKFDKSQANRAKATQSLLSSSDSIRDYQKQGQINKMQKLSDSQQHDFDATYSDWQSKRAAIGKPPTPEEKRKMADLIRSKVVTQ